MRTHAVFNDSVRVDELTLAAHRNRAIASAALPLRSGSIFAGPLASGDDRRPPSRFQCGATVASAFAGVVDSSALFELVGPLTKRATGVAPVCPLATSLSAAWRSHAA